MIRKLLLLSIASNLAWAAGCASITNPVANGVPVRMLPTELLAPSKNELQRISLAKLRQNPPDAYRLGPGDLLGVYVQGVLGQEGELPPVNFPESANLPPAVGYPIPVRADGTIPLPIIDPLKVSGMTVPEAERAVKDAYTVQKEVLLTGEERVLVTLMRPRQTRVLVIRQDSASGGADVRSRGFRGITGGNIIRTGRSRGSGFVVDLPAYQNDVLTALARTGGLPGSDAADEVIIERGYATASDDLEGIAEQFSSISPDYRPTNDNGGREIVRIPLRVSPGREPSLTPEDIILKDGDIVFIESRDDEYFYTAGLLPALEVPLPRDYDLDVVKAIARVGGPILNGGVNSNNLQGAITAPGVGNPSPSLLTVLRRTPDGGQVNIRVDLNKALKDPRENILVQAGDTLVLQETPNEAIIRFFKDAFSFTLFSDVISRTDTTGTTSVFVP